MVIFDFEEAGTGTENVAIATSKREPSGIFCRVQHPCQISIALSHYWRSNFVSHHCIFTTDDVISDQSWIIGGFASKIKIVKSRIRFMIDN